MRRQGRRGLGIGGLVAGVLAAGASVVRAQELEPRSLSPAPVGMNFAVATLSEARGGLSIDPSLPLTNPDLKLAGPVFGYARALDLGGLSGKFDVILPVTRLSGVAKFQGEPIRRQAQGLQDPLFRLSVLVYGAPAMTPEAYRAYKQDLLISVGVQVGVPLGTYDNTKLLNLGNNRWAIRPNVGVSKTFGRWVTEATTDVSLFTENDDFFGGHRRTESPIWASQGHLVYNWPSGMWASADAVFFTGGQAKIDEVMSGSRLQNARAGGTLAVPITTRWSVKLFGSAGVSAKTHNDFGLFGIAWQRRWGGGL